MLFSFERFAARIKTLLGLGCPQTNVDEEQNERRSPLSLPSFCRSEMSIIIESTVRSGQLRRTASLDNGEGFQSRTYNFPGTVTQYFAL